MKLKMPPEDVSPHGENEAAATDGLGDTAVLLP